MEDEQSNHDVMMSDEQQQTNTQVSVKKRKAVNEEDEEEVEIHVKKTKTGEIQTYVDEYPDSMSSFEWFVHQFLLHTKYSVNNSIHFSYHFHPSDQAISGDGRQHRKTEAMVIRDIMAFFDVQPELKSKIPTDVDDKRWMNVEELMGYLWPYRVGKVYKVNNIEFVATIEDNVEIYHHDMLKELQKMLPKEEFDNLLHDSIEFFTVQEEDQAIVD